MYRQPKLINLFPKCNTPKECKELSKNRYFCYSCRTAWDKISYYPEEPCKKCTQTDTIVLQDGATKMCTFCKATWKPVKETRNQVLSIY